MCNKIYENNFSIFSVQYYGYRQNQYEIVFYISRFTRCLLSVILFGKVNEPYEWFQNCSLKVDSNGGLIRNFNNVCKKKLNFSNFIF